MRRLLAGMLMSIANLAIGLAATGWWMQHTVFDPGRTQSVAGKVLDVEGVNDQISDAITEAVATELGQDPDTIRLIVDQAVATTDGVDLLSDVVVDSHAVIIGESPGPVVIDPATMVDLLGDERAAALPAITLPVTTVAPIDRVRRFLDDTVGTAFGVGIALGLAAVAIHPRRDKMLTRWGIGLITVGVMVMAIGYLVPTVVLPTVTTSPWVDAIPEVAADQLGLLAGVSLVCAGLGLGLLAAAGMVRRSERATEAQQAPAPTRPTRTWG